MKLTLNIYSIVVIYLVTSILLYLYLPQEYLIAYLPTVFNFASAGSIDGVEVISFIDKIDFEKAVQFGALIAASEVGTYEGFFKLVKSLVDKFCFKKDAAVEA